MCIRDSINASLRGIDSPSLMYSGVSLILDNTTINCSDVSDYDTQVKYCLLYTSRCV